VAGLTVAQFDPNQYSFYPQCYLYKTTGILCAGCGATRAVYALLHGRFLEAMHDNVLLVCALPLIGWSLGKYLAQTWLANRWPNSPPVVRDRTGVVIIFGLFIAFSVVRNIPLEALDVIRPPGTFHPHFITAAEILMGQRLF
jgi:hypothetical protein